MEDYHALMDKNQQLQITVHQLSVQNQTLNETVHEVVNLNMSFKSNMKLMEMQSKELEDQIYNLKRQVECHKVQIEALSKDSAESSPEAEVVLDSEPNEQ